MPIGASTCPAPSIRRSCGRRADGGPEEILLDGAALAAGKAYFSFGDYEHSPDHRLYAYLIDETGSESFTLRVLDIAAQRDLPDVIEEVADFAWAARQRDAVLRAARCRASRALRLPPPPRHRSGRRSRSSTRRRIRASRLRSASRARKRFIVISTGSSDIIGSLADRCRAAGQRAGPGRSARGQSALLRRRLGRPARDPHQCRRRRRLQDRHRAASPRPAAQNWRDLVPYRQGRQILGVVAVRRLSRAPRTRDGLAAPRDPPQVRRRRARRRVQRGGLFDSNSAAPSNSTPARSASAIRRPRRRTQTFDYDMESRERVLRKEQKIPSGHEPSDYVVRRLFATTADNEQVPITLLHRKGLRSTARRRCSSKATAPMRYVFETGFDDQHPLARRSRLRLCDRACPRRPREGRALAQRRPAREQGQHVQRFHRGRGISDQGRLHQGAGASWRAAIPPAAC